MNEAIKKYLRTPEDVLYRRQKKEVADNECRHLKDLIEVPVDMGKHGIDYHLGCLICGKVLTSEELKQREITLKEYGKRNSKNVE